jgi:hypothetical protein
VKPEGRGLLSQLLDVLFYYLVVAVIIVTIGLLLAQCLW